MGGRPPHNLLGRIDNDKLPLAAAIQRCLIVAEMNEQIIGFAVGLLQPGAPFIPRSLRMSGRPPHNLLAGTISISPRMPPHPNASPSWRVSSSPPAPAAPASAAPLPRRVRLVSFSGRNQVVLEVRASSSAAIALYASLGFTLTARRPRYYQDPRTTRSSCASRCSRTEAGSMIERKRTASRMEENPVLLKGHGFSRAV